MLPYIVAAAIASPLPDLDWRVQNDTVMGGVSSGTTTVMDDRVRFTGELSLENNGGFVSIRTAPQDLGMGDVSALKVRVSGRGRTWSVNAYRSDVPLRAGSYRADLPTRAEGITELLIPLADFRPSSFGRPVSGAPALDSAPGRIEQLGFLLADTSPGPFALDVLSIEVVRERRARAAGHDNAVQTLTRALETGVPQFNRNDHAACRDTYRAALTPMASEAALTDGEQQVVAEALKQAQTEAPEKAAWTLRAAIDTVLAGA